MKTVEIFFDFLSPFSFLAVKEFTQLKNKIDCAQVEVIWRPVLMGQLIHSYETKGPAEIPSKRDYLFRHILRHCERTGLQIQVPKVLPFNSSEALRICFYLQHTGADVSGLVLGLFESAWERGEDLSDLETLSQVLAQFGHDAGEVFKHTGGKEARKGLKENLARALEKRIFGVPSFLYCDEIFWGRDSLIDLEEVLLHERPLPRRDLYEQYLKRFSN